MERQASAYLLRHSMTNRSSYLAPLDHLCRRRAAARSRHRQVGSASSSAPVDAHDHLRRDQSRTSVVLADARCAPLPQRGQRTSIRGHVESDWARAAYPSVQACDPAALAHRLGSLAPSSSSIPDASRSRSLASSAYRLPSTSPASPHLVDRSAKNSHELRLRQRLVILTRAEKASRAAFSSFRVPP